MPVSWSPKSCTCTIAGWLRVPRFFASALKRFTDSASFLARTLMATPRWTVSVRKMPMYFPWSFRAASPLEVRLNLRVFLADVSAAGDVSRARELGMGEAAERGNAARMALCTRSMVWLSTGGDDSLGGASRQG